MAGLVCAAAWNTYPPSACTGAMFATGGHRTARSCVCWACEHGYVLFIHDLGFGASSPAPCWVRMPELASISV